MICPECGIVLVYGFDDLVEEFDLEPFRIIWRCRSCAPPAE